MKIQKDNKNIFQICIDLNDNIPELQACKQNLIKKNPTYQYHYITSNKQMFDYMKNAFAHSKDLLDQKVYEAFILVDGKLGLGPKAQRLESAEAKEAQYKISVLVSRTDIFRAAMLYKYGGLYCDLSSMTDTDIDNDLSQYDFYALKKNNVCDKSKRDHCMNSFLYGKKGNVICRRLLESVSEYCNSDCKDYSLSIMQLAGPTALTHVLHSESKDDHHFYLDHHNAKIEKAGSCKFFKFSASWKKSLHTPDKNNPNLKVNSHWLHHSY